MNLDMQTQCVSWKSSGRKSTMCVVCLPVNLFSLHCCSSKKRSYCVFVRPPKFIYSIVLRTMCPQRKLFSSKKKKKKKEVQLFWALKKIALFLGATKCFCPWKMHRGEERRHRWRKANEWVCGRDWKKESEREENSQFDCCSMNLLCDAKAAFESCGFEHNIKFRCLFLSVLKLDTRLFSVILKIVLIIFIATDTDFFYICRKSGKLSRLPQNGCCTLMMSSLLDLPLTRHFCPLLLLCFT